MPTMWKEATTVQSGLLTPYMTGQTEGNHKTEQMHFVFRQTFEAGTSRIHDINANFKVFALVWWGISTSGMRRYVTSLDSRSFDKSLMLTCTKVATSTKNAAGHVDDTWSRAHSSVFRKKKPKNRGYSFMYRTRRTNIKQQKRSTFCRFPLSFHFFLILSFFYPEKWDTIFLKCPFNLHYDSLSVRLSIGLLVSNKSQTSTRISIKGELVNSVDIFQMVKIGK